MSSINPTKREMTKEQLREKFDEEYEGDKEQLYPLLANSVFDFFWQEIEKRDREIAELDEQLELQQNLITSLKAKISEKRWRWSWLRKSSPETGQGKRG